MKRITLQPAYVLHRRLYRENSFLVELLTSDYGRLSAVARGVRSARCPLPGLLQPFTPLLISFTGKSELMTLTHAEANGTVLRLRGECLFAGFYLNELLMCLLDKWDGHPRLYSLYSLTINALQSACLEQRILRSFEKNLLAELGYGILQSETANERTLLPDRSYRFIPEQGFILVEERGATDIFLGKHLLAIIREDWQDRETLMAAKRLMRYALATLLGSRSIHSRKLFL